VFVNILGTPSRSNPEAPFPTRLLNGWGEEKTAQEDTSKPHPYVDYIPIWALRANLSTPERIGATRSCWGRFICAHAVTAAQKKTGGTRQRIAAV